MKNKNGKFITELEVESQDNFGHAQLGGVCDYLKDLILNNDITNRVKALDLGVLQRCAMHCSSKIDIDEAYQIGYESLKYGMEGHNGYMIAINRDNNIPYKSSFFLVEAEKIANNVRYFPNEWINSEGNNITEEAYDYFKPLLGELPDFKVFTK